MLWVDRISVYIGNIFAHKTVKYADLTLDSITLRHFSHDTSMASAEVALPENVTNFNSRSWTSLPERYFHPSLKEFSVKGKSGANLPVVDLSGLHTGDPGAREDVVRQIGSAASTWGFFQVVNHGVSEDTFDTLYQQSGEFFELPVNAKERAIDPAVFDKLHGYNGRFTYRSEGAPWLESLCQVYRPEPNLKVLAEKIWPGGNPIFCNAIEEFCQTSESLVTQMLELMAEGLGLKPDTFSKEYKDPSNFRSSWRLHHYPPCPDPSRCLGIPAHSDSGLLTVLKQYEVGGLQVRDGDGFADVDPIPGALVINIGDTLQGWSNGRLQSAEHRVVVNHQAERISAVYACGGPVDFVIESPPELIDEAHPPLYFPFNPAEQRANSERMITMGKTDIGEKSLDYALRK